MLIVTGTSVPENLNTVRESQYKNKQIYTNKNHASNFKTKLDIYELAKTRVLTTVSPQIFLQ